MRNLPHHLATLCIALWAGGMWLLGYAIVPVLFRELPDPQLAGMLAGPLFTALAYTGIICALYLTLYQLWQFGRAALHHTLLRITLAMLLLVLIGQFVLQPILADLKTQALPLDVMHSAFASQFKTWHAVSGILFLVQSLLAVALVLERQRKCPPAAKDIDVRGTQG